MHTAVKTLLNCTILTMDANDTWYPRGYLIVEGNRIAKLGEGSCPSPRGDIYDLEGKLVMPGLVNTHTHTPSPLFRGMADDLKLMDWLQTLIWPAEKHLTAEAVYWGTSLACLEFLENGITTFADQYFFADAVAEAVKSSGLRGVLAATVFSHPSPETDRTFEAAADFVSSYRGREEETRIYPCFGPHAPYSCDASTLREVAKLAEHYGVLVHIHISETKEENEKIRAATGLSPTRFLESTGLLDRQVLAAHCIHLDDQDLGIFREKGVGVSYNPVSNLKLVSGVMPLKRLWEHQVPVGLGTDGAQSNNSLDLLRDLKTGVLLQKQHEEDPTFCTAREAVRMLTIEGARALGMADQIGSLEPGKLADLTVLDLTGSNLQPVHQGLLSNLYSHVTYSAMGANVAHVMVDGEFLLYNRIPLRVNRNEVLQKSAHMATKLMQKAGLL
jgi:5-methylthioadenosine/S-adenosylhomocysteine deaminase